MKLKKLIQKLQHILDDPDVVDRENLEVYFKLTPPESVCDNDEKDLYLTFEGACDTSVVYLSKEDGGAVDLGFTIRTIKDGTQRFNSYTGKYFKFYEGKFWATLEKEYNSDDYND